MSKKRVHEIARELKEQHGIEFDNRAIIKELVSLGYDVKSTSSSLEDDQALAALQKIVETHKPKVAPLAPPVPAVAEEPSGKMVGAGLMSKKRVHEIGKELKEQHGIEFDNKAIVTELVSLGYDVKSHSSLLDGDQAIAAVQKIVENRKPKAAPAPVAPRGWVLRKVGESTVAPAVPSASRLDAPSAVRTGEPIGEIGNGRAAKQSAAPPIGPLRNRASAPPDVPAPGVLSGLKIFVDGSNVCHNFGLGVLDAVLVVLLRYGADRKQIDVVFDASFRHKIKGRPDGVLFEKGAKLGSWRQTAAGTTADAEIVARLRAYPSSVVVSNDTFRDHEEARGEFDARRFRLGPTEHDVLVHFPRSFGVGPVLQPYVSAISRQ